MLLTEMYTALGKVYGPNSWSPCLGKTPINNPNGTTDISKKKNAVYQLIATANQKGEQDSTELSFFKKNSGKNGQLLLNNEHLESGRNSSNERSPLFIVLKLFNQDPFKRERM